MQVSSAVPEGKGVSSSASVEVASMAAIAAAHGNFIYQIFQTLRTVENHFVGAPCGVMDQMTSACGEANKLLAMVCQPAEIVGLVQIPSHIQFWGIDSGIRHRVGTYVGRKMIKSTASSILSWSLPNGDGLNLDDLDDVGVELLEDEASLDYLCNLSPHGYEALYAKVLPESMLGETFLKQYADHHDPVTVIDPKRTYGVRAPAKHPVYENFRVNRIEVAS
ncbi:L-arabinokinase-like [Castanea sativa]|uniref:L-arabinokinase-like n=1 Tax=Castanea sativa TaxID=21020 RepID=UPI003F64F9FB